jgi:magnesium chelatase family protein
MFAHTHACTVIGCEPVPVTVEATSSRGLPSLTIVGLRASEAAATRERVRCGLESVGVDMSQLRRTVVSIAPADAPTSGASLDLPIALAILAAMEHLPASRIAQVASHGELGLDGSIRAASGVIAAGFAAVRTGVSVLLVGSSVAERAALAPVPVVAVDSLAAAIEALRGGRPASRVTAASLQAPTEHGVDCREVRGQPAAVEALTIAAAGGHGMLLVGEPGCGKSMLAHRLPTILPPLEREAALEVALVHDAAGLAPVTLSCAQPFRAPHHTLSQQALVGGGGVRATIGELTLAHHGVLFLDELPEFRPSVIDALRQPLEDGEVRIRRAAWVARYPARAQLVAAMNLCKCGRWGVVGGAPCTCTPAARDAYRQRLSGALLDRFDLRVRMESPGALQDADPAPSSATLRDRVVSARALQLARWGGALNSHQSDIGHPSWSLAPAARASVVRCAQLIGGGRRERALIRVARTVADLDAAQQVEVAHVRAALDLVRTRPEQAA